MITGLYFVAVPIAVGAAIAMVDAQGILVVLAALAAPILVARPATLMVACATCAVAVNTNELPVPPKLRFALLALLLATLFVRWMAETGPQRVPKWGAGIGILAVAAALTIDFAGNLSFGTSGQRSLSMIMLVLIAWLVPRTMPAASLAPVWLGLGLSLSGFVILGTAFRAVFDPGTLFIDGGLRGGMANPNALGIIAGAALVWVVLAKGVPFRAATGALMAGALLMSLSRGAILATAIALLISQLQVSARRAAVVAAILGCVALFAPVQLGQELASESRWSVWRTATVEAGHRPLSGVGFGGTEEVLGSDQLSLPTNFQGDQLHNSYVQLIFELGLLPGLVVLIVLGATIFRAASTGVATGTLRVSRAIVIFGLVSAMTESWMFSAGSAFGIIFWLAIGTLAAPHSETPATSTVPPAAAQARR